MDFFHIVNNWDSFLDLRQTRNDLAIKISQITVFISEIFLKSRVLLRHGIPHTSKGGFIHRMTTHLFSVIQDKVEEFQCEIKAVTFITTYM